MVARYCRFSVDSAQALTPQRSIASCAQRPLFACTFRSTFALTLLIPSHRSGQHRAPQCTSRNGLCVRGLPEYGRASRWLPRRPSWLCLGLPWSSLSSAPRRGTRARASSLPPDTLSLLQVIRISLLQIRISLLQARISLLQARLSTNLAPRDSISLSARLSINGMGSPATLRLRPQAPDSSSVLELQTRAPSSSSRLHLPPRAPAVLSALKLQPQPSRVGARRRALPTAW